MMNENMLVNHYIEFLNSFTRFEHVFESNFEVKLISQISPVYLKSYENLNRQNAETVTCTCKNCTDTRTRTRCRSPPLEYKHIYIYLQTYIFHTTISALIFLCNYSIFQLKKLEGISWVFKKKTKNNNIKTYQKGQETHRRKRQRTAANPTCSFRRNL